MNRAPIAAGLLVACLAPSPRSTLSAQSAPAPALERADLERWLDGMIPAALEQGGLAGAVIAVVRGGEVVLQKGYGWADVAAKVPMDPERTVVRGGSLAKLFTWTALMQQVERGALDLDRDINGYLDFTIPVRFGRPITARHLMTHTAGFEERQKQYGKPGISPPPLGVHLKTIPPPEPIDPPGAVQAYSNYGNDLGAYLVERLSGEPFVDYLDEQVLGPLGMTRSTFRQPVPAGLRADLARGYPVAAEEPFPPDPEEPTGDLVTTAADMARFMIAHLQDGRLGDARILADETARLMHQTAYVSIPGGNGTGLGFFGADRHGRRVLQHSGDLAGYHTDLELLPDEGIGLFLAINSDGAGGMFGAAYPLRASIWSGFMDRYFPAPAQPEEPTAPTALEHARLVAGEYQMSRRPSRDFMVAFYLAARIRIEANEDGTLVTPALLDFERGKPQTWREVAPFEWEEVGGPGRLLARIEGGRVVSMLPRDLTTFVLLPVPAALSARINLPVLAGSAVVLLVAGFLWPIGAALRRRFHPAAVDPVGAGLDRVTRRGAATGVLHLLGWVALAGAVLGGGASLDPSLDPWIRAVQGLGLISVAGAVAALWSAGRTLAGPRSWWVKVRNAVVALALADLAWFSFAFGLISRHLNY